MNTFPEETTLSPLKRRLYVLLGITLLVIAVLIAIMLITNKPRSQRRPVVPGAPVVLVTEVSPGDHTLVINTWGTVKPAKEIELKSQVTGKVLRIHPEFLPGGRAAAKEVLVTIDPSDYRLALSSARAKLESAQLDLTVEEGQQKVARRELAIMNKDGSMSEADKELALRKPQLRSRQAAYDAARADVDRAKLDVSRTKITAPFNALIRSTAVNQGDLVGQQSLVAVLVGTDAYWIEAAISVETLGMIDFSHTGDPSYSNVTVITSSGKKRQGRVLKALGDLDASGRMARIIVEVAGPLGDMAGGVPDMLLGDYLEMHIQGKTLNNVVPISTDGYRDDGSVWLVTDTQTLERIPVELVWREQKTAWVRGNIPAGSKLITSALSAAVPGMKLSLPGQPQKNTHPAQPGGKPAQRTGAKGPTP